MKESRKFDPRSIEKLNNPERFERENPDLIWKELGLAGPRVLVEIGAGTGFFAAPFARKMQSGTVYAFDVQDEMLAWMREHLPADVRSSIVPLKMEEASVPLPDGIADLVYMINLHHEGGPAGDHARGLASAQARRHGDGHGLEEGRDAGRAAAFYPRHGRGNSQGHRGGGVQGHQAASGAAVSQHRHGEESVIDRRGRHAP